MAAGPELCAAVTNAGGIGCLGGLGYSPKGLRQQLQELKAGLKDPNGVFGVDLALPQVGGNARKTNYDYTHGQLDELIRVTIEEGAKLFISAVGVAPKHVVDRLHKAGIACMNMVRCPYMLRERLINSIASQVGAPRHAQKALDLGYDLICGQGGEGGGHTGDIPTTLLIPELVRVCQGYNSPLTGKPVQVVAGGGIYRGSSLAAMLAYGATGELSDMKKKLKLSNSTAVWVGTRFVAAEEAGASKKHKEALVKAKHGGE